uniref:Uncharacterized protein n=1 Tax=Arundo donax TaxID=35708 RepID=A0A0A9EBU1_ARUDO
MGGYLQDFIILLCCFIIALVVLVCCHTPRVVQHCDAHCIKAAARIHHVS